MHKCLKKVCSGSASTATSLEFYRIIGQLFRKDPEIIDSNHNLTSSGTQLLKCASVCTLKSTAVSFELQLLSLSACYCTP